MPVEVPSLIVYKVCCGLDYAHNKCDDYGQPLRLVHRDVCPNNIMITRSGNVKLTDFGVAKAAMFMSQKDEYLVGSVEYMSPEQASFMPIDARSDIFSLGLVYYELLTSVRLFQCRNGDAESALEQVKRCNVPDPRQFRSDLPESIAAIVEKCLQKEPALRYQSAGQMRADLESELLRAGSQPSAVDLAEYMRALSS